MGVAQPGWVWGGDEKEHVEGVCCRSRLFTRTYTCIYMYDVYYLRIYTRTFTAHVCIGWVISRGIFIIRLVPYAHEAAIKLHGHGRLPSAIASLRQSRASHSATTSTCRSATGRDSHSSAVPPDPPPPPSLEGPRARRCR